ASRTDAFGRFTLPAFHAAHRITAAKQGFYIASASVRKKPLTLQLDPLPKNDDESYAWIDPAPHAGDGRRCGTCHAEIYNEWSATGHARSATGSRIRNLYEGTDAHGRR